MFGKLRQRWHLLLVAALVGAPSVWAAIRQGHASESHSLLLAAASAHRHVSYAGAVVWSGQFDGGSFGWGKSFRGGKKGRKKETTFGVRHDAGSGATTYSADGPWKQWTLPEPSSRMPDPAAWCLAPDRVGSNYRAELMGTRSFIGRTVQVLRVRPRHRGRPSMEIWADSRTSLPLKVTTYRPDGSVYRVAKFRRVEFEPQPQVRTAAQENTHMRKWRSKRVPLDDLERSAEFRPLLPEFVPDGFRLVQARVKQFATPRLMLLYSDGATAFELSQSPLPTPAVLEAYYSRHMGETHARRMLGWHMRMAHKRLVESDSGPEVAGKITCRYRRGSTHSTHQMRVGDLDVQISARTDLDRELVLQVLRSLHR